MTRLEGKRYSCHPLWLVPVLPSGMLQHTSALPDLASFHLQVILSWLPHAAEPAESVTHLWWEGAAENEKSCGWPLWFHRLGAESLNPLQLAQFIKEISVFLFGVHPQSTTSCLMRYIVTAVISTLTRDAQACLTLDEHHVILPW